MFDCIIVGSGPAGIAASIYAKRYNLDLFLTDKNSLPGGKTTIPHSIENIIGFPGGISGYELSERLSNQLNNLEIKVNNIDFKILNHDGLNFTLETSDSKKYSSRTVIIATGTDEKELGIKGEKEYKGKGVSYCATCDAPFFKNKIVSVIGGGDTSLSESLYLSEFARKVVIIYRRENLRGAEILQNRIKQKKNIEIVLNSTPFEVNGDEFVKEIRLKNLLTNAESSLDVDGVFIFAGYKPNNSLVVNLVKLDNDGYIMTDESMSTGIEGLYAAGDIRSKSLRQIVTAISDGAIAAHSIRNFLKES